MSRKHFIGMCGLRGCTPNVCEVFRTKGEAAEYLATVNEFGKNKMDKLRRDMFLELNQDYHSNEYCEIRECDCNDPSVHSDSGANPFV